MEKRKERGREEKVVSKKWEVRRRGEGKRERGERGDEDEEETQMDK